MELLNIGLQLIVIFIGFYLAFFKSYFESKGKNLATKEDVGLITEEIELVKNQLSFDHQRKIDFYNESKRNTLDFYDHYFHWISYSMRVADVILSYHDNPETLRKAIEELKQSHLNVLKYYSRLRLYSENVDFTSKVTLIYGNTIDNHNSVLGLLLNLEETSVKYKAQIEHRSPSGFKDLQLSRDCL